MNNEISLNTCEMKVQLLTNQLSARIASPLQWLASYYGKMLERPINQRQTLHLLNAQAAFVMTVFAMGSVLVHVLCLVWLVAALLKCREVLR